MSVVVLFAYAIKLKMLTTKELHEFYERCCVMILSYVVNAMNKMLGENLFNTS